MSRSIVIVGSGIIGLATAYYALRKGHSVTLVERGGPQRDNCSMGNAGMVVPSHFVPLAAPGIVALGLRMLRNPEGPFAIRPQWNGDLVRWLWEFYRSANAANVKRGAPLLRALGVESRRCYEELDAEPGQDFGLVKKGLLMLCATPATLHEEAELAAQAKHLGIPAEVLTPEETARLDPAMKMEAAGSVYFPQDCHLVPQRLVAGLTRAVAELGATFRWELEVTGWKRNGGRVQAVRTTTGDVEGDEFVVAGGSWTPEVLRPLGIRLLLMGGKGYSLTLPKPRVLPELCSILTEARVAVTPMAGSLRFAGTMEIGPPNLSVNPRRVAGMRKSIPQFLPEFRAEDFQGVPVWSGLRPCTPDGMPYVGRPRGFANLCIAAGHAMIGVSLGPITGRLVAEIVSGEPPSIDIALLSPDRFSKVA